jgi:hypothetical protein
VPTSIARAVRRFLVCFMSLPAIRHSAGQRIPFDTVPAISSAAWMTFEFIS